MTEQDPQEPQNTWIVRAQDLVKDIGSEGLEHPSTKPVLIGGLIGFVAGPVFMDDLGFIVGAFIGVAIAIARELEKQKD